MNKRHKEQCELELERAEKAFNAAKVLFRENLYEDCVSRAYYAVMHAARAALSTISVFPNSHNAVKRLFGLHLVKKGPFDREYAVILTTEQEDREIGDYGIGFGFPPDRAQARLEDAEKFITRVRKFINDRE